MPKLCTILATIRSKYSDLNLTMHKNLMFLPTQHYYIGHTILNKGELSTTGRLDRIKLHLEIKDVLWQVLATFPAT